MFKRQNRTKPKALTALLIICSALAQLCAVSTYAEEAAASEEASINEVIEEEKLEGDGYATAEDALAAYVNGLIDNDIDEMLSAFAIETFVDNYSLAKVVDWQKTYVPAAMPYVPGTGNLAREINIESRRSEITNMIRAHYRVLAGTSAFFEGGFQNPYLLGDVYENAEDLLGSLYHIDDTPYVSGFRYDKDFIDPEKVVSDYSSESVQKNFSNQASRLGADEVKSEITVFSRDSDTFLLVADCIRYGDKWFIYTTQGTIGSLLNLDFQYLGLLPLPGQTIDELLAGIDGQ